MGGGFKPFGFAPFGVPTIGGDVFYTGTTLTGETTLQIAPDNETLVRLLRGDRLIYLVEMSPWSVSDRSGV